MSQFYDVRQGNVVVGLSFGGNEYFHIGETLSGTQHKLLPSGIGVNVTVSVYDVDQTDQVEVDNTQYIQDNDGFVFPLCVGGRPKSFVKR